MFGGIPDLLRRLLGLAPRGPERQYGAIPWRRGEQGVEFLLITSRRTGRWIFPKGSRIAWLSAAASAAQEAFEEAGVEGHVADAAAGLYHSIKRRDTGDEPIEVEMFALEVTHVLDEWPERAERRRQWSGADEACALISEPELVPMIKAIAETGRA